MYIYISLQKVEPDRYIKIKLLFTSFKLLSSICPAKTSLDGPPPEIGFDPAPEPVSIKWEILYQL